VLPDPRPAQTEAGALLEQDAREATSPEQRRGIVTTLLADQQRIAASLRAALVQLGASADEVADHLIAEHCLGHRASATTCPVSHWLAAHIGIAEVSVGEHAVAVHPADDEKGQTFIEVELPDSVQRFVIAFDHGRYADLDAEVTS
jgi:hypothetical protein